MSSAALTIVFAPTLALLAHPLQEVSAACKGVRGVKILLVLGELPQTFGYCVDNCPIGERDGLQRNQYVISKRTEKRTSAHSMVLSLNEHRATSALLTYRLTSMSLGRSEQSVILEEIFFTYLRGRKQRPLRSQLARVSSSVWAKARQQLMTPSWVSKLSILRIDASSLPGLSLRVRQIPQVVLNK